MKIKPRPAHSRKERSYLKWMGLLPPRKTGRLAQLNTLNRRRRLLHPSEFLLMARRLEQEES